MQGSNEVPRDAIIKVLEWFGSFVDIAQSSARVQPQKKKPLKAQVNTNLKKVKGDDTASDLPDFFDMSSRDAVLDVLQRFMPGPWTKAHGTNLWRLFEGLVRPKSGAPPPPCVATDNVELIPLMDAIDFTQVPCIFDPWSGTGSISRAFAQKNIRVITNDINIHHEADYHLDALQPATYKKVSDEHGLSAIVTSPWFGLLDIALPLGVAMTSQVVAIHVPGHYLTSAARARIDYFKQLQEEGRLMLIMNLPKGPTGWRCLWIVVFASKDIMEAMVRPEFKRMSLCCVMG